MLSQRRILKQATRRAVLRHARRLCARRGFAATRTLDVTRAAGLSHGALFVHFPTREELLREVAVQMGRELTDELHRLARAGSTLREALAAHLSCLEKQEDLYRQFLLAGPGQAPGFRRVWTGIQSAVSMHLHAAVERETAAGKIRAMPQHLLFNTWIGLVHHYILNQHLFSPHRSVLMEHGAELIEHFLALLAKEDS